MEPRNSKVCSADPGVTAVVVRPDSDKLTASWAQQMVAASPLAFVDLETTGLSPRVDRIAEIGIVAVDGERVQEWTTLLRPRTRPSEWSRWVNEVGEEALAAAPCFKDIAGDLAERLAGRRFIAHNARFDYGFLKAEFQNVGIDFRPPVICSAMLSRKLNGHFQHHNLDALLERHDLRAETRHRALPDARLVWQFWQAIHREHPKQTIEDSIRTLLAGPVLPSRLDPAIIDKLPEMPGVYFLHGERDEILHIGCARNLRLHLLDYFRVDRASPKALTVALRVANITWRVTDGLFGAQMQAAVLSKEMTPSQRRRTRENLFSWQIVPEEYPSLRLSQLVSRPRTLAQDTFGNFHSERKARNGLLRLAAKHRLCHCLLGIRAGAVCAACGEDERGLGCGRKIARLRHLAQALVALESWRVPQWPYPGPIGLRERRDIHVFDDWRYLGTARTEPEIYELVDSRLPGFDESVFRLLARKLARLPLRRLLDLSQRRATGPAGKRTPEIEPIDQ